MQFTPIRDDLGILHADPAEKAELLQAQYSKVFSDPDSANIENCLEDLNPLPKEELGNISFDKDDIVDAIKELDPYSSIPDGDIPARVLTKYNEALKTPIFRLWRHSFESGLIPAKLKSQYITLLLPTTDQCP